MSIYARDSGVWVKVADVGGFGADGGGGSFGSAVLGTTTGGCNKTSIIGDGTSGEVGQHYDVYSFIGTGTLSVSEAGVMDIVAVGGGGPSSGWGGGGGGHVVASSIFIDEGTFTMTVSAGSNGSGGSLSSITHDDYDVLLVGGGGTSWDTSHGWRPKGGHSVYKGGNNFMDGDGHPSNYQNCGGGGGGAGAAGGNATSGSGGKGGDGYLSHITGNPVYYGAGGAACRTYPSQQHGGHGVAGLGGAQPHTDGAANTGQGAGGQYKAAHTGGSGIIICRVPVQDGSFFPRTQSTPPRTAHAALIENGEVQRVIVIPHLDDDDAKITEYCNSIGLPGVWVDTSYTGSRRGKYAGVGDLFDLNTRNAEFVSPDVEEEAL